MRLTLLLLWALALMAAVAPADSLSPDRLAVAFNRGDAASTRVAEYYAERRHVPAANLIGIDLPDRAVISRQELKQLRDQLFAGAPSGAQAVLLIWSRPYAVECMSITTAVAAGYQAAFCEPGCRRTKANPLFDSAGWLPADTIGWLPAMLLPSQDVSLARAIIDRGILADGSRPPGTVYLVRTNDPSRNVRAAGYAAAQALLGARLAVRQLAVPIRAAPTDVIGYFTGVVRVEELPTLGFRPGAVADHLTSSGGALDTTTQMSSWEWLKRGATASYGTVVEPCNHTGKFPDPGVFFNHYLRGETLLEAYWKSVAMPGQGLFIGEPLARPFGDAP